MGGRRGFFISVYHAGLGCSWGGRQSGAGKKLVLGQLDSRDSVSTGSLDSVRRPLPKLSVSLGG